MQYDVVIKVRSLQNYFVSRVPEEFKCKIISWKFCPGKCFVWMGESLFWKIIYSYYSVHVLVCCYWRKWKFWCMQNISFRDCVRSLKSQPFKRTGFYSSCGGIPALAPGGKQSSYERWHCYHVLDSRNLHFVVQKRGIYPDMPSNTQVSDTGQSYVTAFILVLCVSAVVGEKKTWSFSVGKWYVSVKLMFVTVFQLVSWSKRSSHTNTLVFCFYICHFRKTCNINYGGGFAFFSSYLFI